MNTPLPAPEVSVSNLVVANPALSSPPADFRLLIVTDAWKPQVNGVSRTYQWLAQRLQNRVVLEMLTPEGFATIPLPAYPDIRLALTRYSTIARRVEAFAPDVVHIATEGPLGHLARKYCLQNRLAFTTCYHTRFPEYLSRRLPVPLSWSYGIMRRFHNAACATMVATQELGEEMRTHGFERVALWRRGIDVPMFRDGPVETFDLPRPLFLYVGRLAVEKNIPGFLRLDLPGTKVVVGDGPMRGRLERDFPGAHFMGAVEGPRLGAIYRAADVFVFPSLTDTFGLVMAEALAAGVPVASYPTSGARAILGDTACGAMDEDLRAASLRALQASRDVCREAGARHSLEASIDSFLAIIHAAARGGLKKKAA